MGAREITGLSLSSLLSEPRASSQSRKLLPFLLCPLSSVTSLQNIAIHLFGLARSVTRSEQGQRAEWRGKFFGIKRQAALGRLNWSVPRKVADRPQATNFTRQPQFPTLPTAHPATKEPASPYSSGNGRVQRREKQQLNLSAVKLHIHPDYNLWLCCLFVFKPTKVYIRSSEVWKMPAKTKTELKE